eukprot:TRINITY_DN4423_c0_g1_i1.p1 TRINITY_DN4423_c0_g1~~TRINITY_DN4423_c0_g1_i1.p1  ORF type:complete len:53 (-),score=5.95 TRINITY_DN4423_c0_g1_i1:159-296(-)
MSSLMVVCPAVFSGMWITTMMFLSFSYQYLTKYLSARQYNYFQRM